MEEGLPSKLAPAGTVLGWHTGASPWAHLEAGLVSSPPCGHRLSVIRPPLWLWGHCSTLLSSKALATVPQKAQARNTLFFGLWAKGEGSREGWEEGRQSSEAQGRAGRPTGLGGSAGGLLPREGLCPGPEPKALNRTSFHFLKGSLLPAVQISRLFGLSGCSHSAPGSPSVSVWVSTCAHPPCEFPSTVPLSALPGV